MKLLRGIAIGMFCVLSMAGISQNGFTTYTTNLVLTGPKFQTALLVDNSSNKWVGFRTLGTGPVLAGLIKYDNVSWTIFSTVTTPSLVSNYVTSLAKDNTGNIWIGTDSGLVKYDGSNFTNYSVAQGLPGKFVRCVEVVGNDVFVGTNKGLSYFDGTNFTNYNVANGKLSNDTVTCIKAESVSLLWLGGRNKVVEFNFTNSTTTNFTDHFISDNPNIINCIFIDSQNMKWLGTTLKGILRYDGSVFKSASLLFNTYGSTIPPKVADICEGLHQGIVFRHKSATSPYAYNGLTELTPGGKVFQYFRVPTTTAFGDYIEKDGNTLLMSTSGSPNFYQSPKMYSTFESSTYVHPLGIIHTDNFRSLDINNVNAGVGNRSHMHGLGYPGTSCYEVPKFSGKHTANGSGFWITGKDNTGQLRGGFERYFDDIYPGNDFWPGPLDTVSVTIDTVTAKAYDKIWKVSYTDINTFITAYNSGSIIATPDMLSWPAHGIGNNSRNLAPFVDVNSDGNYNPYDGDYPKIKGDQTLYYIYNDMASAPSTSLAAMGIEVHAMAYAYGCAATLSGKNELANTTFYNYKIINRSSNNYSDVYVGLWSEAKSGTEYDDYVGCNVSGNFAYVYDADNIDSVWFASPPIVYGNYPPAQGTIVLKGPVANINDGVDNDNDQVIDEVNEDCKMNSMISFFECESAFPTGREYPYLKEHFYNVLQGKWRDSTSIMCGLPGPGPWNVPTSWMFPGDPNSTTSTDPDNTCGNWTENNLNPCSQNFLMGSGPFTLNAGQIQEVEYAFVTSFDSTSTVNSNLLSVAKLKTDMQKINAFYNLANRPSCLQDLSVGVKDILKQNDFILFPNPANASVTLQSTIEGPVKIDYEIVDVLGKTVMQNQNYNNSFTLNVSDLNAGIYFIRLKINNSLVVKKFVKE